MVGPMLRFEGCEMNTMENVVPGDPRRGAEVERAILVQPRGGWEGEVEEQRGVRWRATRVESGCLIHCERE